MIDHHLFCRALSTFKESARRDSGLIHSVQLQYRLNTEYIWSFKELPLNGKLSMRMNLILLYLHVFLFRYNFVRSFGPGYQSNRKVIWFQKTSQKISNLKSLSSSEKLKKFLDKWKYFMTLHWMIFQVSNMQNSHYQSKYWLCNFHQYW